MLDSLHIQNYRLFKDLKIEKLGQVNLIAGKNNTGKTALLEALRISIYCFETTINNIIYLRDDYYPNDTKIFESLFYKRDYDNKSIKIISKYGSKNETIELLYEIYKRKYGFFIKEYDNSLTEIDVLQYPDIIERNSDYVYLSLQNDENLVNEMWKKVSLTPLEDEVTDILKIIDNRIIKVRVDYKKTMVLLEKNNNPVPLKNLGDGANRLFTIALALVNAKDKMLLIDEFEVGLHHSIQKQLWEIIFKYAKEWNIQVFVTTHSRDTVEAFTEVWNKSEDNIKMGNYFRLQRSKKDSEQIEAVIYDNEMLEIAVNSRNIEMR